MRKWLIVSLVVLIFVFFVVFRIVIPFQSTFSENGVQLNTVDAYYMVRYAETFPDVPTIDYFFNYPDGLKPISQIAFSGLIFSVSKFLNISILTSAAIIPPILFLLILLAVFFICRFLFKDILIALSTCLILSVIPGEIMYRTILGASDYHCLEILLSTCLILYVIMAVKDYGKWLNFMLDVLLAIVSAILYIYVWTGGIIGLFIIGIFLVALLIVKLKWWSVSFIVVACGMLAVYILNYTDMALYYWNGFTRIFVPNINTIVTEEMPLFFTSGRFDFVPMWNYFGITFYLFLFGLGFLAYHYVRYRKNETLFLLVWTVIILVMTFAQRRFAYYLAINVAIISAYVVVLVLSKIRTRSSVIKLSVGLFLIIVVPFIRMDIAMADYGRMPVEWQRCTEWLNQQRYTNVSEYVKSEYLYKTGKKADYAVLSWWDYGNWIIVKGRTPAICTPYDQDLIKPQGRVASILTETNMTKSVIVLKEIKVKYIVIDSEMLKTKLYPIVTTAKADGSRLRDMLMYRLFYFNDVNNIKLVWDSDKLKVFEVIN